MMLDALQAILESQTKVHTTLANSLRLREDLGMDSLQLAVLTVKVEAEFGVDIFADGLVHTVGDVEAKIQKHLDAKGEN